MPAEAGTPTPEPAGPLLESRLQAAYSLDRIPAEAGTPIVGPSATTALIEIISEKTGYPAEGLELDMRLDEGLGIGWFKRVEILSALQEKSPGLPTPSPDRLSSCHTLRAIAECLGGQDLAAEGDRTIQKDKGEFARVVLETVAEKTGYPAEMLEL